jgi:MraZ protein
MITGEYRYSLDEKGRMMIPAKIRNEIAGSVLVLTRGIDRCLWLFPPEEWKAHSEQLLSSTSLFHEKDRLIHRRIIAPAQEVDIDRSGRVVIPPTLREYGGLAKNCIVLGMLTHLELWDEETYREYWDRSEDRFLEAAEEIGDRLQTSDGS